MCDEMPAQRNRRPLVKEHLHSSDFQGPGRVFENCSGLFQRDSRKPFQELGNLRAVFEVLEKCGHRYSGASEHPRTAYASSVAFDGSARGPVDHGVMLRHVPTGLKVIANARLNCTGVHSA